MDNNTWDEIPTIEDYFDLDEINNIEEVEEAFYEASKEYGWSTITQDQQGK